MAAPRTEIVTIYRPTQVHKADHNVVPGAFTLVAKGVAANIHRGTSQGRDEAAVMGITGLNPSLAYFDPGSAALLSDRCVLVDGNDVAWLVHGIPSVRTRFASVSHARCLLTQLLVKPSGVS